MSTKLQLRELIPTFLNMFKNNKEYLDHNADLFTILDGDLLSFVSMKLQEQLSPQSLDLAKHRIAPINVLKQIIDKVSKLYTVEPRREVVGSDSNSDAELLAWYEAAMAVNTVMNSCNEDFNLTKTTLIQPIVHNGKPKLRCIKSDRFMVYSDDAIDPTEPTAVIVVLDKKRCEKTRKDISIFVAYSDDEMVIYDSNGAVRDDLMAALDNPEGVNEIGIIPFIYVNRSLSKLQPVQDTDIKQMTTLIPVLLSDLNYASMFQSFSVLYTIGLSSENIEMSPNALWQFKPDDDDSEAKPEVGSIKPQVDVDASLKLISSQLAFWLQSRGIRPGSVGELSADSAASGISKIVDEADTTDDRNKQSRIFSDAEFRMWELIFKYLHPYWSSKKMIDNNQQFTQSAHVLTNFTPQTPLIRRGEMVKDLALEVESGFTTKARAIKTLNPALSDTEVEELLKEVSEESLTAMLGDFPIDPVSAQ